MSERNVLWQPFTAPAITILSQFRARIQKGQTTAWIQRQHQKEDARRAEGDLSEDDCERHSSRSEDDGKQEE